MLNCDCFCYEVFIYFIFDHFNASLKQDSPIWNKTYRSGCIRSFDDATFQWYNDKCKKNIYNLVDKNLKFN